LSNEEKTNEHENFEKGMIYMKILKKGDSREKGGGGNEIHAPCACANIVLQKYIFFFLIIFMLVFWIYVIFIKLVISGAIQRSY